MKRPLKKYFIDWQARTGKKINILGNEETPATLASVRTEKGHEERIRNKTLLGIDKQSRNKDTIEYVVSKSTKANCLTGAVHAINLIVVQNTRRSQLLGQGLGAAPGVHFDSLDPTDQGSC